MVLSLGSASGAASAACRANGLSAAGLVLVRVGSYVTFRHVGGFAVRVGPDQVPEVAAVEAWRAAGLLVMAPALSLPVPFGRFAGSHVGFWEWVPSAPSAMVDVGEAGRLLAALQAVPPPAGCRPWPGLGRLRARLVELDGHWDRGELTGLCDLVDGAAAVVEEASPVGLVHGDFHPGNLLPSSGGLVVIDPEQSGVGPLVWDLVPLWNMVLRYGFPVEQYRLFVDAYVTAGGVADPEAVSVLVGLRAVESAVWAALASLSDPMLASEAALRVNSVLQRRPGRWSLF